MNAACFVWKHPRFEGLWGLPLPGTFASAPGTRAHHQIPYCALFPMTLAAIQVSDISLSYLHHSVRCRRLKKKRERKKRKESVKSEKKEKKSNLANIEGL